MVNSSLQRPTRGHGRVIAGVCAAVAHRFGVPTLIVRLLFVIFAVTGAAELAYIVLWILIPKASRG